MRHYDIIALKVILLYIVFRCSHRNHPDHIVIVFLSYPNRYQYVSTRIKALQLWFVMPY